MSDFDHWRPLYAFFLTGAGTVAAGCDRTMQVTSTDDGESGSLRAAITEANRVTNGALRIELPGGTYELTRCGSDDDNENGDLDITTSAAVTLIATAPGVTIRQTCAGERVLEGRGAGLLSLSGITFTGGSPAGDGGAILGGAVALTRVTLLQNQAANGGGVAAVTLSADNLTAAENRASATGGGVFVTGKATIRGATIRDNRAGTGGGIQAEAMLSISDAVVTGNVTYRQENILGFVRTAASRGGGILADVLHGDRISVVANTVHNCSVSTRLGPAYAGSTGSAISARVAKLVNASLGGDGSVDPECFLTSRPGDCCRELPIGATIQTSESLSLDHTTIVSSATIAISTPELSTHRSAATGNTICAFGYPIVKESSYNWFAGSCALSGPGDRQESADLALTLETAGGIPVYVPAVSSPLVERIPVADCPVKVDARGNARPQGPACDVGAFERSYPPELGATDLSLDFESPAPLVPGQGGSWKLLARNNGIQASPAVVSFAFSSNFVLASSVPSAGGSCQGSTCRFDALIPGASASVTITGDINAYTPEVTLTGSVTGLLAPPYEDDRVSIQAPVRPNATLRASASGDMNHWDDVSGPTVLPVYRTPAADLLVKARRRPGIYAAGEALPVEIEVTNIGDAASVPTEVTAYHDACCGQTTPHFEWSRPSAGSREPNTLLDLLWNVPTLAPGQAALIQGSVRSSSHGTLHVGTNGAPDDNDNNSVDLSISPAPLGTADLQIASVQGRIGASNDQYVATVTLKNAGESAYTDVANLYVQGFDGGMQLRSLSPGWTCSTGHPSCSTSAPLPPGDTTTLEITLTGWPSWLHVRLAGTESVPDPDPNNNVWLPWS